MTDEKKRETPVMVICPGCRTKKPSTEFRADKTKPDGLYHYCRICAKAKENDYRSKHRERYRALLRAWHQRNPGMAVVYVSRYAKRYPHKVKAKQLVLRAVRRGELARPKRCTSCGSRGRIHGHHPDYTKPLDVVWLCPQCHAKEHRR